MMSFAVLTIVTCVFAQTFGLRIPRPRLNGRIVGGENAAEGEIPYQLSLQVSFYHICGASLLSSTKALTAAHCTDGFSAEDFSVRAGSIIVEQGGVVVSVTTIKQHPNYKYWAFDYDVSLLILAQELELGSNINVITLQGINEEPADGTSAVVSGWGVLTEGGGSPSILQKVTVNRVNTTNCNSVYESLTDRMICYAASEKDSCQGDSGGPLVGDGKQIGIVSWGVGCARPRYPGVYTKISDPDIHNHITLNL